MRQEIFFKGLNLAGDDHNAQPGELSLCAGVEVHDGALRPSVLTGTNVGVLKVDDDVATLLYTHVTPSYTHYVAMVQNTVGLQTITILYWFKEDASYGGQLNTVSLDDIRTVNSVGNTLIVMTASGLNYFLYRSTDAGYKSLGNRPPFVRLQFRPNQGMYSEYGHWTGAPDEWATKLLSISATDHLSVNDLEVEIDEDKQSEITEAIWALINKTNNTIANDGGFYAPFLIRYCYRLYDGTMFMHSAPVFMNVSLPLSYIVGTPNVTVTETTSRSISISNTFLSGGRTYQGLGLIYRPNNVWIQYRVNDDGALAALKNDWGDIVKSIDIFITPPIMREQSGKLVEKLVVEKLQYGVRAGELNRWFITPNSNTISTRFDIPALSDNEYVQKIRDSAAFFKLKTFNLDEDNFPTSFATLNYDKAIVANITTQEQMTDDYKSHNNLLPHGDSGGLYVYNHRAHVYGIQEQLFQGFCLADMVNQCSDPDNISVTSTVTSVVVELNTEDGKKYVRVIEKLETNEFVVVNSCLFYPDARAVRMIIFFSDGKCAVLKMEPCSMLNGAMAITPFLALSLGGHQDAIDYLVDDIVPIPNKIYQSEVNNPYFFPVQGINTVGLGSILGVAAATRALSQGQFGRFPLMAFCSDGIWALEVSSSGTYSTIHPISREVCVNANSICQLDQSVIFATDRALSNILESTVKFFSSMLDGPIFNHGAELPNLANLFAPDARYENADIATLLDFSIVPIEYFKHGHVIYDFSNERLLVLPPVGSPSSAKVPAYVLSLRDLAWSTMLLPALRTAVNAYPYPYIQYADGTLMLLNKVYSYADDTVHGGIVVTRPLSYALVMQAIQSYYQNSNCQEPQLFLLYGSNDLRQWHYIGRSQRSHSSYLPAHAFRYFRIALFLQMRSSEKYSSIGIDIIEKYQKL